LLHFAANFPFHFKAKSDKCYFSSFLLISLSMIRLISLPISRFRFRDLQQEQLMQRHAAWTISMGMKHGHPARTSSKDMQHEDAEWACSMEMLNGHAAWRC
jgi:hypothetical protein